MTFCDLCNTPLAVEHNRYSPSQIKNAVRSGLRPPHAASQLGAAFGMSQKESEAMWVQQVMTDTADWLLCPSYATKVTQYLR